MSDRLALPRRYRDQLEALLRQHVPSVEVWAYGSRVNGESHEGSDLDLALRGPALEPLDAGFYELLEAIEKSNIPILVQAHDWAMLPESFHREIERGYVLLQERSKQRTAGEWCELTLGDIAEIVMGQSPPGDTVSGDHGLALLNGPTEFGAHHPSPVQFTTDVKRSTQPGDILFCVRGSTTGRMNWADQEYAIGRGVAAIRHREEPALQPFIRGIIQLALPDLLAQATGSTFPNVSAQQLAAIPFLIPPLPEQRAIAHVLGTLDDKIELNRRMNETLEEMARALFQDWFVDFGPVRAKMEGRWRPGESLPGLPAEHYDLFPDRMVGSELGEVPEGWVVKALGDCFNLTMGQSPPGSTYNDDGNGTPFYQGSTDFGERYPTNRRYCTEPARLAQTEDTLVSVRAPVGAINRAWERCCIGRGVAALRHKSGSAPYTYYAIWAAQPEIGQYEHTGTVFGAIGGQQFRALLMLEPHDKTVAAFHRIGQDLDNRIRSNVAESRALTTQRDALLPRLVSGELAITHIERWLRSNED